MPFSLRSVRIPVKLTLSSLIFALPIALLTYFTVSGLNANITFAQLERQGNAYLRPLARLLETLPKAPAQATDVEAAFAALAAVQAQVGQDLKFTPDELAKRGRGDALPSKVQSAWSAYRQTPSPAALDALMASVRTMITHAGDTSNLILDPDLDSYYLMDVALLALPQTLDRLSKALRDALPLATGSDLTLQERSLLWVYAAMLREADLDRVTASLTTALKEDESFYGTSASLQASIPPLLERYVKANEAFIKTLDRMSRGAKLKPQELTRLGEEAVAASMALFVGASAELDVLLDKRIGHYKDVRSLSMGLSLVAVILAGLIVFFIARDIVLQLTDLRRYARQVAGGALETAACTTCHAELGELASDLQTMVRELRRRLGYTQGLQRAFKVPMLVAGPDSRVTFTNQELLNFIELSGDPEDYHGMTVAELVRNDANADTVMGRCLRDGSCVYKAEIAFSTRKGNTRYALVDSELLHDLDGAVLGVVGVLSDITDIKRHESELEKRNTALVEAVRASQDIAHDLGEAMRQLAERIHQAAEGASHQNRRASDTVEAMAAMNASAQEVADLAGEAAQSADKAKDTAREGETMVRTAVKAIAAVQSQVLTLQEKMQELGAQADNVGKVLQVIGDIADQTNLLALNAAIEAARAGDAGRGFAVVADEVRKLAEKTMQATHEVGSTLDAIRGGAAQTLQATEKTAREIVESTRLAESSGEYLARIVAIVQGSSDQAKAIARAAGEQAQASSQANRSVSEIESISARTTQGMEEASQALHAVSSQAVSLEELIKDMGR